jgi:hypothetical protein
MPPEPTATAVSVRPPSLAVLLLHIAIAPLLIAVWAMCDAGLPGTIYGLLTACSGGPFARTMQSTLEKEPQTWIRAGFAVAILLIWLGAAVSAWRRWQKWSESQPPTKPDGIPDGCWVIVTLQVATLVFSLFQIDALSWLGLPWRVRNTAAAVCHHHGDVMFAAGPDELEDTYQRLGIMTNRNGPFRQTRILSYFFREVVNMRVQVSPTGDALTFPLGSCNIRGDHRGLVYLRSAATQPEAAWLHDNRIRWDERVRLHDRLYVVRLGG